MPRPVVVLGIFVADATFRTERLPILGETRLGSSFALGPGGKGSNQAVAAARAGGTVHMITRIGPDTFGQMGRDVWAQAGVISEAIEEPGSATGAACIMVEDGSGDNAIIVTPGASADLCPADLDAKADLIKGAGVFITQLEQPQDAALRGLELAREGAALSILNPAPAAELLPGMLALCDLVTPNESEAEALSGIPVSGIDSAKSAAAALIAQGAGAAIITLGANGVLYHDGKRTIHVPANPAGPVVETTGAGDAFNGGLCTALAEGRDMEDALRFGCATAGISVSRPGAAASMPGRDEIEAHLARGPA